MPKLYLLRHAEAPSCFELSDKDRPLSTHGISQAKNVAAHLKDIDLVLCSSATRTKMTCAALIEGGANFKNIEYLDALYNAPAGDLLSSIQTVNAQNIMVIAHNPGIHVLANRLVGGGDKGQIEKLNLFYNPATLSIFECDIERWADIQPHQNTLIDLIIPD